MTAPVALGVVGLVILIWTVAALALALVLGRIMR